MLTDETGNLIGKYEYDAFGQILSQPEGTDNRFTFTGREYDKDSGLYFYRARYYDASVGRFLTRDPQLKTISTSAPDCDTCGGAHRFGCGISSGLDIYNPSELHPYVYVRNNPVNISDPYGEAGTLVTWETCDYAYREFKEKQRYCEEEKSGCPPAPTGSMCKELKDWMTINRYIVKRCGEMGMKWWERIILGVEPPFWWQ